MTSHPPAGVDSSFFNKPRLDTPPPLVGSQMSIRVISLKSPSWMFFTVADHFRGEVVFIHVLEVAMHEVLQLT